MKAWSILRRNSCINFYSLVCREIVGWFYTHCKCMIGEWQDREEWLDLVFSFDGSIVDEKERWEETGKIITRNWQLREICVTQVTITHAAGATPNSAAYNTHVRYFKPNQVGCTPDCSHPLISSHINPIIILISHFHVHNTTITRAYDVMSFQSLSPFYDHKVLLLSTESSQDWIFLTCSRSPFGLTMWM